MSDKIYTQSALIDSERFNATFYAFRRQHPYSIYTFFYQPTVINPSALAQVRTVYQEWWWFSISPSVPHCRSYWQKEIERDFFLFQFIMIYAPFKSTGKRQHKKKSELLNRMRAELDESAGKMAGNRVPSVVVLYLSVNLSGVLFESVFSFIIILLHCWSSEKLPAESVIFQLVFHRHTAVIRRNAVTVVCEIYHVASAPGEISSFFNLQLKLSHLPRGNSPPPRWKQEWQ